MGAPSDDPRNFGSFDKDPGSMTWGELRTVFSPKSYKSDLDPARKIVGEVRAKTDDLGILALAGMMLTAEAGNVGSLTKADATISIIERLGHIAPENVSDEIINVVDDMVSWVFGLGGEEGFADDVATSLRRYGKSLKHNSLWYLFGYRNELFWAQTALEKTENTRLKEILSQTELGDKQVEEIAEILSTMADIEGGF